MSRYTESATTWLEPETLENLEAIADAQEYKRSTLIRRYIKQGMKRDLGELKLEQMELEQSEVEDVIEGGQE